jgi:hypothetical protein
LNLQRAEGHNSRAAPAREYAVYGAFISYSHALDKPVAAALQSCVRQVQQIGHGNLPLGISAEIAPTATVRRFNEISYRSFASLRGSLARRSSLDPSSAERPEIASLFAMTVGNW